MDINGSMQMIKMKKLLFLILFIASSIFAQNPIIIGDTIIVGDPNLMHFRDTVVGWDESLTDVKVDEKFNYPNTSELARTWETASGTFTMADSILTSTSSGALTTVVNLDNHIVTGTLAYRFFDGSSWSVNSTNIVSDTIFTYSDNLLSLSLDTGEKIDYMSMRTNNMLDTVTVLFNDQNILATTNITLSGATSTLYWGDGESDNVTSTETIYSHDYSSAGDYVIYLEGGIGDIDKFVTNHSFISGSVSDIVENLDISCYFDISSTSITGDANAIAPLTESIYIDISGSAIDSYTSVSLDFADNLYLDASDLALSQSEVDNFTIDVAVPTLGSDILDGWGFLTDWNTNAGVTIIDDNLFTSTGTGGVYSVVNYFNVGDLYALEVIGETNSSPDCRVYLATNGSFTGGDLISTSLNVKQYFVATRPGLLLRNDGAGNTNVNSIVSKQVTSYSAPLTLTLILDGTNASRSSASDEAIIAIVDAGGTVQINGGSFGAELVVNGDFANWTGDDPDGWGVVGESGSDPMVTEVSGACRMFSSSAAIRIQQDGILTISENYRLTIDVVAVVSNGVTVGSTLGGDDIALLTTVGSKSFDFTALGTAISIKRATGAVDDITFDNVSVRKILP